MLKKITIDMPPVDVNIEVPDPVTPYKASKEVWLATTGVDDETSPNASGTGTELDPLVVGSAEAFDNVFRLRIGSGTTYKLYPGTYWTNGCWAMESTGYAHLGTGDRLIGLNGSGATTIRLSPGASFVTNGKTRPDAGVFFAGKYQGADTDMRVQGVTFDGNEKAFTSTQYVLNGLRFTGPNVRAYDVRVINIRGTYDAISIQGGAPVQLETFGITAQDSTAGSGGGIFEDCHVVGAPNSYVTGIYMGYGTKASAGARSLVIGCTATGGRNNQAGFAFGSNVSFRDCTCSGFKYGFYTDTDYCNDILIDGCSTSTHYTGFTIVSNLTQYKTRISIRDSYFSLKPDAGAASSAPTIGISAIDACNGGAAMGPISVYGCTFECASTTPFYAVSLQTKGLRGVRFVDTTFPTHAIWNKTPETPLRVRFNLCLFADGTDALQLPTA